MPPGCTSRFHEKWQPLARVAQVAGPKWLEVMMRCAAEDVAEVAADRDAGLAAERPAILLLRHIVELWPHDATFWATTTLVDTLVAEHPEVWGEESGYGKALTPQRMGKMLVSSYRIRSTKEDIADKNSTRGYRRDQFRSAIGALHSRSDGVAHDDTPTLPKPSGPSEPAEPSEGATVHDGEQFPKPATVCTVCGQSLFPADIAEGADRHAGCIPSGWAS